jgi:ATP-dependent protease ClpP protease subunit
VAFETEGFAIYDAMMQMKTEVCLFSLTNDNALQMI